MINNYCKDGLTFHCTDAELVPPLSDPTLNKTAAEGGYNGYKYRACPLVTGKMSLQVGLYRLL